MIAWSGPFPCQLINLSPVECSCLALLLYWVLLKNSLRSDPLSLCRDYLWLTMSCVVFYCDSYSFRVEGHIDASRIQISQTSCYLYFMVSWWSLLMLPWVEGRQDTLVYHHSGAVCLAFKLLNLALSSGFFISVLGGTFLVVLKIARILPKE